MSATTIFKHLRTRLHENNASGTLYRLGFFIVFYFTGRYLLLLVEGSGILSCLHKPFLWVIDSVSVSFWSIFYPNIASTVDYIVRINNNECIQLLPGCSGLQPILRMTFILFLYPISWQTKSWLLPLSWLIILFAATIHFILLIPIAYHLPEYYKFSHNWLTKIIFYGFYFLTWIIWEKIGYPKKKIKRDP